MSKKPVQVVAAIDFGPESERVLKVAYQWARGGGSVHALHIVSGFRGVTPHPDKTETQVADAMVRLEAHVTKHWLKLSDAPKLFVHVLRGSSVPDQIIELSYEAQASMVVMGNPGDKGGSVVRKVVHMARCPIVVVNDVDYSSEGFLPPFKVCETCRDDRMAGIRWYCDTHRDAASHDAKEIA